ncbi:MAG: hypothetical protein IIB39_05080 [Candidatus Marinimicrobia bacterium]|nr:hypothetical protein [Candidatus Neomarinimicrobiota bacterium]
MKNANYMNLTLTRAFLLILLILSPMAGVLADIRCIEDCNDHSQMKMIMTQCCHMVKMGISVQSAQGCDDELTFNVDEYRQLIKTKSVKNILFSEKNSFHIEEAFPKFRLENDLSNNFLSITANAIYLLDSAFLI